MYWFDPVSGRRRRARLRDQLASTARDAGHIVDVGSRDLNHRFWGLLSKARHAATDDTGADDSVLEERVRACLGRAISHPGAIEVEAMSGRVTLRGDVLSHEHHDLTERVRSVRGVSGIDDQLAVHADARGISALQGGRPRVRARLDVLNENWSPATRLLIGGAGVSLALVGLGRRTAFGALALVTGSLAVLRTVSNVPLRRLSGAERRAIEIRKTVHIQAPVERVFGTLSHFENYPLFMHYVRSVRTQGDGRRLHWVVVGPAGVSVEWDSETTQLDPNRLIAWRSLPGGPVRHEGVMRFASTNGSTRLEIQMSYVPPAGVIGHRFATLFGADPKRRLDDDMVRVKTFIETGRPPRDAAAASRSPDPQSLQPLA